MSRPFAEVVGDPIAQSKSPLIHTFWLEALGLAGDYRRAHVKPEELAAYIEARRADLRFPFPPDFAKRVEGRIVEFGIEF